MPDVKRHIGIDALASATGKGADMPLTRIISVFGPPAAGKTTLTLKLAQVPGRAVFRLREHVPELVLAATATSAERLGWIDDLTVTSAVDGYFASLIEAGTVHTVFLDNFPGTGSQVRLLLATLRELYPAARVEAVELIAAPNVLNSRARNRRVCHRCERDPIRDPRLPAQPSEQDPGRCSRCGNILHPRRGDAPSLFRARMQRYQRTATGIRAAFADAAISVYRLQSGETPDQTMNTLTNILDF